VTPDKNDAVADQEEMPKDRSKSDKEKGKEGKWN